MKWGLGAMRIPPRDFWKYSLREWTAAIKGYIESQGGDGNSEYMERSSLEDLMVQYPDVPEPQQ
jgi:uncharacterized phage protein (TIGR02216 family)